MIDAVLHLIVVIFFGFFIILPVYTKLFRESIWQYVNQKIKEEEKHEKLQRKMRQQLKAEQCKK